jgi:hypothetical protein
MGNDIEVIIERLAAERPDIRGKRLKVSHEADDDGLWFFSVGANLEVQFESTTGNFPFLVESNANERRMMVYTVDQAILVISNELTEDSGKP